jgi:hypothetical protein
MLVPPGGFMRWLSGVFGTLALIAALAHVYASAGGLQ